MVGVLAMMGMQSTASADESHMMCGVAMVDITPTTNQPLGGYLDRLNDRGGRSECVHDRLYARVLVLRHGNASVAIVTLDLLFFTSRTVTAEARRQWGIDHVILSATHTHAGPLPTTGGMPEWSNLNVSPAETLDFEAFADDPWYARVEADVIAAIGEAAGNLFPARIGAASGVLESPYLAHNRRQVGADGRVRMLWDNPKRLPTQPVDHTVRVLRIDDVSGKPRVVLVGYACHPVILGPANRLVSADFPGATVREIERHMGADTMAMFLQGASGDIDPYEAGLSGDYGFLVVQRAGEDLAAEAVRVAGAINTARDSKPGLRAERRVTAIAHRNNAAKHSDVAVTSVVINQDIALVAIPGEPFIQHQIDLAEKSPTEHTFLLGLAQSGEGLPFTIYLPTEQAAAEGGYGADTGTFLVPRAGEILVNEAVASIHAMIAGR